MGGRQYRLVVFPPGTDDRERWLLRALRWWPLGGALAAVFVFGVLSDLAGLSLAVGLTAAFYVGPLLTLRHTLRRRRRDLVVLHAEYVWGPGGVAELARCRRLVSLSSTLIDAEHALDRGELTPVDFQRVWGDVHAQARGLEAVTRAA
jgi:hypothetical protein